VQLNAREKRFVIIGSVVAGLILVYYAVMFGLPSQEGLQGTLELKRRTLLRQRETIARAEQFKASVERSQQRLRQDLTRLLPGDNPSIAAAELQKLLKDIADQNGLEIIRKDIQREQKLQDNIVKVPVRIETNCGPEQLVQFLVAVQNYEKFLTVDELVINSFRIQKRYEIRPSITVAGFIVVPTTAAAPKAAGAQ
jgi:Tfp pilus assembly protein PilO